MCVYACDNWNVSDRSVRKLIPGTTVNEKKILHDVDKYCCVGFHVKLATFRSNLECFSLEFESNQVVVLGTTVL